MVFLKAIFEKLILHTKKKQAPKLPSMRRFDFVSLFQVVYMIRDDILPHSANIPKDFVEKIMTILNKGSIHSTTSDSFIGKYTLVGMLTLLLLVATFVVC